MSTDLASNESYRLLFEHNPQPMWVYDAETLRFLTVNEAAVTDYGYSRAQFERMRITDIRPPEDVPALLDSVAQTTSEASNSGVWRHRRADGRILLVEIRSHALTFGGRRARLVLAADVTAREAALDALRRTNEGYERQYAALVELTRRGLSEGGFRALREITEVTARTLGVERVSVWRFTPARDAIVAEDLFQLGRDLHTSGHTLEAASFPAYFEALHENDVIAADDAVSDARTCEFSGSYLGPNGITSMLDAPLLEGGVLEGVLCLEHVGPVRQWTASERSFAMSVANLVSLFVAQRSRAESDERFQLLARATNDAIWDLDIESGSLWWNEGFHTLFGFRADKDSNLDAWAERVHPDDRERVLASLDHALAAGDESWSAEYRFRRRDGSLAHVLDRGQVLRDQSGRAFRMIGGMTDLTERKQLESQLLHSQKLESLGRLAGGVAHDFNNLLTVVLGTVELVLAARANDAALHDDLREVHRAAERAASLTQQLLAFSRRQVLQPRVVNLNHVVSDTVSMLRRLIGQNIELVFRPDPDLWNVTADAGQFEQVLVNLAVNARDAMPGGGTLVIETANVDAATSDAQESASLTGPHVLLQISDSGEGMDASAREHAFEPFFTTKAAGLGTGLGLATVYGVVQQSGGAISLDSEVGSGTRVTIRLPRTNGAVVPRGAVGAGAAAGGTETVLIVEDEAPVRRLAERVLRGVGYDVLAAASGDEALDMLGRRGSPIHLLLTDVVMPRMSGPELARIVAARSAATHILYMSGYTQDAAILQGVRDGRALFLEKPFTPGQLAAAVRTALDVSAGADRP